MTVNWKRYLLKSDASIQLQIYQSGFCMDFGVVVLTILNRFIMFIMMVRGRHKAVHTSWSAL